jgi:hypothetical protein
MVVDFTHPIPQIHPIHAPIFLLLVMHQLNSLHLLLEGQENIARPKRPYSPCQVDEKIFCQRSFTTEATSHLHLLHPSLATSNEKAAEDRDQSMNEIMEALR